MRERATVGLKGLGMVGGLLERREFEAPMPADLAGLLHTLECEDS